MENIVNLQCNKIVHLENLMVMYGIYNSETLEKLIVLYIKCTIFLPRMKNCLLVNLLNDKIGIYLKMALAIMP